MELKIKRPAIWITLAYIIGILIAVYMKWKSNYLIIALVLLALVGLATRLKGKGVYLLLTLLLFILIGATNTYIQTRPDTDLDSFLDKTVTIYGQVWDLAQQTDSKTTIILEARRVKHAGIEYEGKSKIRTSFYLDPEKDREMPVNIGDWVELKGKLERPQGLRNPKGFDYRAYLARRGIHYTMGVANRNILSINPGSFSWPKSWLMSARGYMEQILERYVGGSGSRLLKAMIIGQKWSLPSDVKEQFINTGIAHILAISGLHVGFVVLLLSWFTNLLTLSPKAKFFIQCTVLAFYCLLVGGNPSVIRATTMAIIVLGGRVAGRKADPINSLSIAAFLILLLRPLDLLEVGFQLSFGAVAGIALYNEKIESKLVRIPEAIASSIAVILAAQLGTWALLAYHFNTFSPISFIANLIFVPIAGVIVILGLLLIMIGGFIPIVAKILGWWLWLLCSLLINGNEWVSYLPWASLRVVSPGIVFMIAYYFILLILSYERPLWIKRPWRLSAIVILIILLSTGIKPAFERDFKIVFLDVGQGDCIYIRTPDRKHILVDGGGRPEGWGDFDVGTEIVLPFLLKNGINELDLVVMSHCHDDHIGGLIPVVEDLKVNTFMEFPPRDPTEKYGTLKELISRKDIENIQAIGGESYRVGKEVFIDIIYPTLDSSLLDSLYGENENNLSLVMAIRYQDASIMLTGDIEKQVESHLSKIWGQNISVLKVAHHGSKTSSTDKWLDLLKPRIAIIQSGKNSFGHPDPQVIDRLLERDTSVYRNDKNGAITCVYKGGKWHINTIIKD